MNRNCLFSKAVALLLCAVLLIGYLPSIALPAAAAKNDEWEGEPDVVETTTGPEGAQDNPIFLPKLSNTVTVPAGKTVYYYGNFSGMMMTVTGTGNYIYNGTSYEIDGVAIPVKSDSPRTPIIVAIQNTGDADAEYTISFAYPLGTMDNPATAVLGDNSATVAEGTAGYFFIYTAEKTGTLVMTMSAGNWQYTVNNLTTGRNGDIQDSSMDPVVNPYELPVTAGDEIQIIVNTFNPDDWYNAPAGSVSFNLAYKPEGPIVDENLTFLSKGLSYQEYIGLQFLLRKSVYDSYDSLYVEAVQATPDGDVTEVLPAIPYASSYYVFDKQILSWSMTERVTITIRAEKDGIQYQSVPVTYSVKELAMNAIAANYTANRLTTCRVLVDMLNYGAAVQEAFNHNATNLPNADLGSYSDLGTSETPTFSATNSITGTGAVKVYQVALSNQSKVELQMLFKATDVDGCEIRYTVDGVTNTIDASEFVAYGSYKYVRIAFKAANLRKVHTIALYNKETGEAVTQVYDVSVEGYAESMLAGNTQELYLSLIHI